MIPVRFYQLALRPVEVVAPGLVVKALEAGHRLLLRSADAPLLGRLDEALWAISKASFVPHGRVGVIDGARVASQPVLLDAAWPPANGADCLVQLGGVLPDGLGGLRRVMYLFGAEDVGAAREGWRRVKAEAGMAPEYWREGEGGRFEKAA